MLPKSPVCIQPSFFVSAVFSGRFQYLLKIISPRTTISPSLVLLLPSTFRKLPLSSIIAISQTSIDLPILPNFLSSTEFIVHQQLFSVNPYASITLKPSEYFANCFSKLTANSTGKGAALHASNLKFRNASSPYLLISSAGFNNIESIVGTTFV